MNWLQWVAENWFVIVVVCLFLLGIIIAITNTQKTREWLRFAVSKAEIELGTGTGQLKLRTVYDMFIKKFPILSNIIPFSIFSKMVDLALEWMKEQINKNDAIKEFIEN